MRKFPYKAFKTFHCHHLLHMAKSSVSQAVRLTGSLLKTALIWLIFSTSCTLRLPPHSSPLTWRAVESVGVGGASFRQSGPCAPTLWSFVHQQTSDENQAAHRPVHQLSPSVCGSYHRETLTGRAVLAPPYSDACQSLLTLWTQWDVKRLLEHTGDWGWLTTLLFISFTSTPAPCSILRRAGKN